jgi:heme exporter protein CcmD
MNWAEFFSMDGRGFYVWGSFGAFLLLIVIEIIAVRLRIHRAQEDVRDDVLARQIEAKIEVKQA